MPTVTLTAMLVERAHEPGELRDTKVPGLICRVRSTGRKTFEVTLKRRGVRWSKKLGAYPHMTVGMAREQAQALLGAEIARLPTARTDRVAGSVTLREFCNEQYFARTTLRAEDEAKRVLGLDRPEEGTKGRKDDEFTWAALLEKPLRDIRRGDIEGVLARWRRSGAAPATVNRKSTVLRAVLSRAYEWHELTDHPMKGIKPLHVAGDARVRTLSDAERGRLYGVIDAEDCDSALGTAIYILLNTGARMGELRGLRAEDVDRKHAMLTIRATTSKVAKSRRIPINATLAARLKTHRAWTAPTRRQWDAILHRARVSGFTPHHARHDFLSRLANAGVPAHVVKQLAGHSSIVLTDRYYLHTSDEAVRAAVEKF